MTDISLGLEYCQKFLKPGTLTLFEKPQPGSETPLNNWSTLTVNLPRLSIALAALLLGTTAHASSSEAWVGHDKILLSKCLKASTLKNPKPAGTPALFDDSIGYTALLLTGTYPQKFMNNKTGVELCLFHRPSQKAVVSEWDGVNTAPQAKLP